MRTVVVKVSIGLAITAIGMYGASNSVGTWKRNVASAAQKTRINDTNNL
jgi:hypothetical protein